MVKLVAAFALSAQALAQDGTIYLIRHGEKDSQGCESSKGMERANNMYDVFHDKFDVPEYVFSYNYEGTEGWECQRCHQTAEPIAKRIGMSAPDKRYGTDECSNTYGHCPVLAGAVLDKLNDVNIVLMVAEHNHILRIAYQLGAPMDQLPEWPGSEYDTCLKLKYKNGKMTSFTVDKEGQFGPTPSPSPSPSPHPSPSPPPSGGDTLFPDGKLASDDFLSSANDNAQLVVQGSDGNMVIHHAGSVVWSSGTAGHPGAHLKFQGSDGNLVLRDASGKAIWSSHAHQGAAIVQLQDDCNLVTKDASGKELWSLGTHCSSTAVTV